MLTHLLLLAEVNKRWRINFENEACTLLRNQNDKIVAVLEAMYTERSPDGEPQSPEQKALEVIRIEKEARIEENNAIDSSRFDLAQREESDKSMREEGWRLERREQRLLAQSPNHILIFQILRLIPSCCALMWFGDCRAE